MNVCLCVCVCSDATRRDVTEERLAERQSFLSHVATLQEFHPITSAFANGP